MISKIVNTILVVLTILTMTININSLQTFLLILIFMVTNIKFIDSDNDNLPMSTLFFKLILFNLVIGLTTLFIQKLTSISSIYIVSSLFLLINSFSLIVSFVKTDEQDDDIQIDVNLILVITVAFVLASVSQYVLYSRLDFDFGNTINMDSLAHITAIQSIGEGFRLQAFLTEINSMFTLNTYLPIFHWILYPYINSSLLENSMIIYNVFQAIFTLISSMVIGKLILNRTNNVLLALLAVIVNAFAIEMTSAFTTIFFLPQTLATLWAIVLIWEYISDENIDTREYFLIVLSLIFLLMLHIYIGLFTVIALILVHFFKKIDNISLSLILTFGTLLLIYNLIFPVNLDFLINILNDATSRQGESISFTVINIIQELWKSHSYISILTFIGLILCIFSQKKEEKILGLLFVIFCGLISINIPYTTKLLTFIHYLSIPLILIPIQNSLFKYKTLTTILIPVFIYLYLSIYIVNKDRYIHTMYNYDNYGFRSQMDKSIQEKVNKYINSSNYILISDPLTMHMYEPFIKARTTGGIFTESVTRTEIYEYLNKKNEKIINRIFPQQIVLLITPKTEMWMTYDQERVSNYLALPWSSYSILRQNCDKYKQTSMELLESNSKFCIFKLK